MRKQVAAICVTAGLSAAILPHVLLWLDRLHDPAPFLALMVVFLAAAQLCFVEALCGG